LSAGRPVVPARAAIGKAGGLLVAGDPAAASALGRGVVAVAAAELVGLRVAAPAPAAMGERVDDPGPAVGPAGLVGEGGND
jgi:hypothetical protein